LTWIIGAPEKNGICTDKEKARAPVGSRAIYFRIEITIQNFKINVKWVVTF